MLFKQIPLLENIGFIYFSDNVILTGWALI